MIESNAPQNLNVAEWKRMFRAVLEEQRSLVQQLAALADRQRSLIDKADSDALLALLSRRQEIIARFTRAQNRLTKLTENLEQRLDDTNADDREEIQATISEISAQLEAVMKVDQEDQHLLDAARTQIRQEIGAVDQNRQARQAYLARDLTRNTTNRFADRKG